MNDADIDRVRSVLERLVGNDDADLVRITFESGEAFVLRYVAEIDEEDRPEEDRDLVGAWSGLIVAAENLDARRGRLFVPGSGIIFVGSEITKIEDELTGEVLFSRGVHD